MIETKNIKALMCVHYSDKASECEILSVGSMQVKAALQSVLNKCFSAKEKKEQILLLKDNRR